MGHLTTAGLVTLSLSATVGAAPDIQFHDILGSARANCRASSAGQFQEDPQHEGANGLLNASRHVISSAEAAGNAIANAQAAYQITHEENVTKIWGYATSSSYAQGDGSAEIQYAIGGGQIQFTLDRETRFAVSSCSTWMSDSPVGGVVCSLTAALPGGHRLGEPLFVHNLLDANDCLQDDMILEPGTYEFSAICHISGSNEGQGQTDDWAEIDVKFSLDELVVVGDIDDDGDVDGEDLAKLLGSWGTDEPTADFNGDGVVDGQDLALLLGNWD